MEAKIALGTKMAQKTRAVCPIGAGRAGDKVEWAPELNRASDVVKEWSERCFWKAMAEKWPSGVQVVGASDGSQRGRNGAYG